MLLSSDDYLLPMIVAIYDGRLGKAAQPAEIGSTSPIRPTRTRLSSPPNCSERRRQIGGDRPTGQTLIHRINPPCVHPMLFSPQLQQPVMALRACWLLLPDCASTTSYMLLASLVRSQCLKYSFFCLYDLTCTACLQCAFFVNVLHNLACFCYVRMVWLR